MKQALTAGGSISVWFESAKIAIENMGFAYEEDFELPGLKGTHPDFGDVEIDFFVPVDGKTRMEITYQDVALLAKFKENVVPAFRYVSELVSRQPEEEADADEEAEAVEASEKEEETTADPVVQEMETVENEPEVQEAVQEEVTAAVDETVSETDETVSEAEEGGSQDAADMSASEATDDGAADELDVPETDVREPQAAVSEPPAEQKTKIQYCKHCQSEMKAGENCCPVCGKKQKGKGGLIALIIFLVLVVIGGMACFAAYKYTGGEFSVARIKSLVLGNGSSVNEVYVSGEKGSVQLVTVNQYAEVQIGMTYDKVCSILGGEGTFLEPEVQLTYANGDVVVLKTYYWAAKGTEGANVCVTFRNGLVETISQFGLQN